MPIVEWNNNFLIGVKLIDEHHHALVMLANELYDALDTDIPQDVFMHYLQELIDYTDYHFKAEEALMAEINYPDLNSHKKIHDGFIEKTKAFFQSIQDDPTDKETKTKLKVFLEDWLLQHILKVDTQIAKHANKPPKTE
ncbi:MAG: hypothetical protein D6767_02920 [Candidatus Hydrogenedentota bacterium]|nr:MAG: hypothetical protein D6767_02920 [Candidatus Hydrogenedentota bacterium]